MTKKDEFVERLYQLDTCAISDTLDTMNLTGVAVQLKPMWQFGKIAGRAVTVKLGPKTNQPSKRHLATAAIEASAPGDIIVVEHCRDDVAGWGGILSTAAKAKGLAGVIIDGACRDVDESRDHQFPVYAKAAVPTTARGRIEEKSFNEQVTIENVSVSPGDYILADGSGITFIPSDKAEEIISRAEAIAQKESMMADQVLNGKSIVEVMGAKYETMLEKRGNG